MSDAEPVTREQVEQATSMLLLAMGIDPTADVTDDGYAGLCAIRDGLLDVVVAIDGRLARFIELVHIGHGPTADLGGKPATPSWCPMCRAAAGEGLPTVTVQRRWSW